MISVLICLVVLDKETFHLVLIKYVYILCMYDQIGY